MKNENLHNQIVKYVTSQGKWLRAGNNNIINYLARAIGCGASRLSDIREVLLAPSDLLYVEHDNGHIRRIGLKLWLVADIEIQEVPEDLASAWDTIESLRAQLVVALSKNGDVDEALELASDSEARACAAEAEAKALREQLGQLTKQVAQPVAGDSDEVTRLKQQIAGHHSAMETRQATVTEANRRTREAEAELKKLMRYRKIIAMLETPRGMALVSVLTHLQEEHGVDLSDPAQVSGFGVLKAVV